MPIARTDVSTDRAGRYLAQLCEHLNQIDHQVGHGAHTDAAGPPQVRRVDWTDHHGVIELAAGTCTLDADGQTLTIALDAADADELRRMQELFATRLQTIGRRDGLTVTW